MARKKFSDSKLVLFMICGTLVYACGVLIGAIEGVVVGLILGIIEVNLINTFLEGRMRYLFLATILNTGLTSLFLTIYCLFLESLACHRSPIFLSIIPGAILTMVWLPIILRNIYVYLKSGLR